MSEPVLVRYASPVPYAGQGAAVFSELARAAVAVLGFRDCTISVVGGVAKLTRPRGIGEAPPPGSEVKIGSAPWVPYTGQALP